MSTTPTITRPRATHTKRLILGARRMPPPGALDVDMTGATNGRSSGQTAFLTPEEKQKMLEERR
jgi:hypothetical protein